MMASDLSGPHMFNSRWFRLSLGLALMALFVTLVILTPTNEAYSGGIGGSAVNSGCSCHSGSFDGGVDITIDGLPTAYEADTTYTLDLSFTGGPEPGGNNHGGFNIRASEGLLGSLDGDSSTKEERSDGSITQTGSGNDQRQWSVTWTSPASTEGETTLRLVGLSVDGDSSANDEDLWNILEIVVPGNFTDASLAELQAPSHSDANKAVDISANVINQGNFDLTDLTVAASILLDNETVWENETIIPSLEQGEQTPLNWIWKGGPKGRYDLMVKTDLVDNNQTNDELASTIVVAMNFTDAGVTLLGAPSEVSQDQFVNFITLVKNLGTTNLTELEATASAIRNGQTVWTAIQTLDELLQGAEANMTWSWPGNVTGRYTVRVELATPGDENALNDQTQFPLDIKLRAPKGRLWTVTAKDYEYSPRTLNIDIGDSVVWIWEEATYPHNVAQSVSEASNVYLEGGFYSGGPEYNLTYMVTFDDAGVIYYLCEPHVGVDMKGIIYVGEENWPTPVVIDDDTYVTDDDDTGLLVAPTGAGLLLIIALGALINGHFRRRG